MYRRNASILNGGLHVFTLCICLLICDMHWCGFADLSHYEKEFSWVVNWPHWLFVVGSALSYRMTHTQKRFFSFSFFVSTCTSCPKINGIFKITTSGDSFPIFSFHPPSKGLVARQWKLPTWLIFTRRQSRNPERWYARSHSLYRYHSITYLFRIISPKSYLGFHCWRWTWRKKRRKRKDARDLFGFKPKIFFHCAKKTNEHKTQNKLSQLMLYIIPLLLYACVILRRTATAT